MDKALWSSRKGNVKLIKAINEGSVLQLVRDSGPISRSAISRLTGLTPPTVSSMLDSLVAKGMIEPVGLGTSTGGRKPLMFRFNPDAGVIIGVDVGATKMAGGVTNLAGQVLVRETLTRDTGPPVAYDRLVALIESLLAKTPPGTPVRGIGLGVAGVVDYEEGVVTVAPGMGWQRFPLRRQLEARFGLPVFADNDVNLLLLGEQWLGAARGAANVLCVAVGTGIGASIMVQGQMYRGANDGAGEVGYFATDYQALAHPPGSEGGYGFLESVAAGPAIARRASALLGRTVSTPEVMRLAQEGDRVATEVVQDAIRHIGIAVANMVALLNPELVVLTGGVMRSSQLLFEPIRAIINRIVPVPPHIVLSDLKEEAGILGAVALVIDSAHRLTDLEV